LIVTIIILLILGRLVSTAVAGFTLMIMVPRPISMMAFPLAAARFATFTAALLADAA
jgi:hypothetical protein